MGHRPEDIKFIGFLFIFMHIAYCLFCFAQKHILGEVGTKIVL